MDAAPAPLPAGIAAKPLLRALAGERVEPPPLWLMRQAGRYLPEYRALRGRAGSFLECCNTPALAAEISLQPVRRFGFDAAIVFSDILVVPHAMGRALRFADGEGPLLAPLEGAHAVAGLEPMRAVEGNPALLETLALLRQRLAGATALIGFAGAPFTLAAYMIDGESGGGFAATRALMAADPALLDRLVETLAHAVTALLCAQIEAGAEAVQLFESWGSLIAGAEAFERWIGRRNGVGGIISAGGSGGTALAAPAMRRLPVGTPKVMISTVASGDVGRYVGASDIMMMYSVTDVQGLNRISRRVLANGANALAGMVRAAERAPSRPPRPPRPPRPDDDRPGLGLTMFGVTTPAVRQLTARLEDRYDCLIFHATGVGGRSMEKLADSGLLAAAADLTTTEVCDMMMGGVLAADEDRFGAFIRTRLPWVGSVGALDMVNFGPRDTVPEKYCGRRFVEHNPQVTLMRTTPEENARMGEWIAGRVNRMAGPVRFLLPEGGISALDAPGQPFHDPEADRALFDAIGRTFEESANRRLLRIPHHVNDPAFADAAAEALAEIHPLERTRRRTGRHAAF